MIQSRTLLQQATRADSIEIVVAHFSSDRLQVPLHAWASEWQVVAVLSRR
jgi:hypothetical protein